VGGQRIQNHLIRRAALQDLEALQHAWVKTPPAPARVGIEHHSAAQRFARRRLAQDEAVSGRHYDGLGQAQLQPTGVAPLQLLRPQQPRNGRRLRCACEKVSGHVVAQRSRCTGQHADRYVHQSSWLNGAGPNHYVATAYVLYAYPRQVHGQAAAGRPHVDLLFVCLQTTDACAASGALRARQYLDCVAHCERTVKKRPRDNRAKSAEAEHPIDWQARSCSIAAWGQVRKQGTQSNTQVVHALAGHRAEPNDLCLGKARFAQQIHNVQLDQVQPFSVIDQVDLGHGDQRCRHSK